MEIKENVFKLPEVFRKTHRLATIVNDSNDAITLQGLDGTIMAWNQGAEKLYKWTDSEAVGMNIKKIIPPHKIKEEEEMIEKIINGEVVPSFETQRVTKNENIVDVWITATVICDEEGRPESVATTERDITQSKRNIEDLKAMVAEMNAQKEKLEKLNTHKNKVIGFLAHDLRSPIVVINQAVSLLGKKSDSVKEDQNNKLIKMIERASLKLNDMVNDMLDISKIKSGHVTLEKSTNDYESFLKSNVELVQIVADEYDMRINVKYQTDMRKITFDPDKLGQVIYNLVNNAVKYSPKGSDIDIVVTRDEEKGKILTQVIDRGEGIPEEYIEHIFNEFFKKDRATKMKVKSTGLGLSIVKKIVELHRGEVWVESELGKGSTFQFTLPL